jgi:hypothetical protein
VPIGWSGKGYEFDTRTGRSEILNRRIGRNELAAEQVCLAIVDAQREYVMRRPMGGDLPIYASKVVSDPGKRNGLYWPTTEGEPPSPLGPLAAEAAEDYRETAARTRRSDPNASASADRAYYGYRYRLLTTQGTHASGGALSYLIDGQLIGGFAVVAYPTQYGNSGIMTFMTNHDGIVYQRDLGPNSEAVAHGMPEFDPGPEWTRVTGEPQPEPLY